MKALVEQPELAVVGAVPTYDEHGGYYDHVAPRPRRAATTSPMLQRSIARRRSTARGIRVPDDRRSHRPPLNASCRTPCTTHTSILRLDRAGFAPTSTTDAANAADAVPTCPTATNLRRRRCRTASPRSHVHYRGSTSRVRPPGLARSRDGLRGDRVRSRGYRARRNQPRGSQRRSAPTSSAVGAASSPTSARDLQVPSARGRAAATRSAIGSSPAGTAVSTSSDDREIAALLEHAEIGDERAHRATG